MSFFIDERAIGLLDHPASGRVDDLREVPGPGIRRDVEAVNRTFVLDERHVFARRAAAGHPFAAVIDGRPVVGGAVKDPYGAPDHIRLVDQLRVTADWIERGVRRGWCR